MRKAIEQDTITIEYPITRFDNGDVRVGRGNILPESWWRASAKVFPQRPRYAAVVAWLDKKED